MSLKDFLIYLFASLAKRNIDYAILRSYESLPDTNKANDIDILIQQRSAACVHEIISQITEIKVAYVSRRSHVINYYLRNINDGERCCLQLDFVFHFERFGVRYMDTKVLLNRKEKFKNFNILSRLDQALVLYLSKLVIHETVKAEYRSIITEVASENIECFINEIKRHARIWLTEDDLLLSLKPGNLKVIRSIKKNIFVSGLIRQPVVAFHRYLRHLMCELKIIMSVSSRSCVYVSNPDILESSKGLLIGSATIIKILRNKNNLQIFLNFFKPVRAYTLYLIINDQFNSSPHCHAKVHNTGELVRYLKSLGKFSQ